MLSIEIWLVGLGVAASMVSASLLPWAVGIAAGFWILRWIILGAPARRTPADFGIGLLLLMIPVTLWATASLETTRTQVFRLLTGILFFYAFVNWLDSPRRLRQSLWGVILVGVALSVGAVFGVEWVVDKIPLIPAGIYARFSAALADTANPNVLAGNLVILYPFAPCLLIFAWKELSWGERGLAVLACLVGAGVLLLAQSRSALIALMAAMALILAFRWKWAWLLFLILLILGAVLVGTMDATARQQALMAVRGSLKLDQRVEIWSRAIYMIRDFPFTGVGMGSFKPVAEMFYPFLQQEAARIPHAHNLFLQVAVDLGIPGLIAWLSILLVGIAASWQVYRRSLLRGNRLIVGVGVGLLCSQAALIAHGLTDAVTWGMVRPAPIVWALWGFGIAVWRLYPASEKSRQATNKPIRNAVVGTPPVTSRLSSLLSSRWFRWGMAVLISGVAVYLALRNVDFPQVWASLAKVRLRFVFMAFLSVGINNLSKSIRWKALAGKPGAGIRQLEYFSVFLMGQMLNTVFPGRLGELGRAYVLGGMGPGRAFILGTILVEKVIDSFSYGLLFLFLLLLVPLPEWVGQGVFFFVGLTLLISAGVTILAFRRSFVLKFVEWVARFLPDPWEQRILPRAQAGLNSLDILQNRAALAKSGFWSVVIWGTAILTNRLILQAFEIDLPWTASLLILIVLQAGISVPSVPGKIGIFEYTCVLALAFFGIDQATALGYGLVLHGLVFLPTTLAGLAAFWGLGLAGERGKFREGVV